MADNINDKVHPYNNRYSSDKDYNKLLFRPDRPLQQSELIESQSIQDDGMKKLGNSLFEDGSPITGMEFNLYPEQGYMEVESGEIYVEGKIRNFKKQQIEMTFTGEENIGVKVDKTIITAEDDPELRDPTQNVASYQSAGADRLKEVVILTNNDDDAPIVFRFRDGNYVLERGRPEFSGINNVLAERTYDESGNYRVEGFEMYGDGEVADDENAISLSINAGRAYVRGYQIKKPSSERINLRKSLETRDVIQETTTYDTNVRRNRVGSQYVESVNTVVGRSATPSTGITISKGTTDGRDPIPSQYTNIDRTTTDLWRQQSASNTTRIAEYTYNTDYRIVTEGGIQYVDWNTGLNGSEPPAGTTYYIAFEYDRIMTEGTDYAVDVVPREGNNPGWDTFIDFNGLSGAKPIDGGMLRLDYDFYLGRQDRIVLDQYGDFTVSEGQPDRTDYTAPPTHNDPFTLSIGTVRIFPNSTIAIADNNSVTRLTMDDIQRMKRRLKSVEANLALTELERGESQFREPLDLRGIFSDGFVSMEKADLNLSDVAFSFEDASITMPTEAPGSRKHTPELLNGIESAHDWGRLVSAPFTENREIHQGLATEAWNVNPYMVFARMGTLKLTPSSDNWVEEEKIQVERETAKTIQVDRWWARPSGNQSATGAWAEENLVLDSGQDWEGNTKAWDIEAGRTGWATEVSKTTTESIIDYIRPREVSFTVKSLAPQANNLELFFDGVKANIEPTNGTQAGTVSGSIRSDSTGSASGKFMIPSNIRTGTREVTLRNNDSSNTAFTTYTAQGVKKVTEEVVLRTRVTVELYDPLAQSFVFTQDRIVSSVGIYMGSKDTEKNLLVQIRGLSEGGQPNRTIYAETTLEPSEIAVSNDGSAETRVYFDDPFMARGGENYCIVLITGSANYTAWVATLGQPLINNPSQIANTQPYTNGVLFSSSNAISWTVHNASDLKFSIYTATFNEEAIVEFAEMTNIDADKIMVMGTYLTPQNTGCFWEVKVIPEGAGESVTFDSVPWRPLINYIEQDTNQVIAKVKLRATFKANRNISPLLNKDDLLFVDFITATQADYVTRNANMTEAPFNQIVATYDAHTPPGSSVTPYYSVDRGQTWNEFVSTPELSTRSAEYVRYHFEELVQSSATLTDFKFKLELRSETRFLRPRVRRLVCMMEDAFLD